MTSVAPMTDLQQQLSQKLRQGQRLMAQWHGGKLAVAAVPGAGKSTGMAVTAALVIAREKLHRHRQLIIVTYTRSAAGNIRQKVSEQLRLLRLPTSGFVVQTLHGLALGIATAHRELTGIDWDNVTIITDGQKQRLIKQAMRQWIDQEPRLYQLMVQGALDFDGEDTERLRRQTILRTDILPKILQQALDLGKGAGLSPSQLQQRVTHLELARSMAMDEGANPLTTVPLLTIATGLYSCYAKVLADKQLIDYEDMVLGALRALSYPAVQQIWQQRTFAVFEDEAQDSSPLQEKLINYLAPENVIRVGDPNQAINATFTAADPLLFNRFCDQNQCITFDQAGRSNQRIIQFANAALGWMCADFAPKQPGALRLQAIRSVDADDPQPNANPAPIGLGVEIYLPPSRGGLGMNSLGIELSDIEAEADLIVARLKQLCMTEAHHLKAEASDTAPMESGAIQPKKLLPLSVAVLYRNHVQGKFLSQALQQRLEELDLPLNFYDVERSINMSRIPAEMLTVLRFIERPHSTGHLKTLLELLQQRQLIQIKDAAALAIYPERFLFPTAIDQLLSPVEAQAALKCRQILNAKPNLPLYHLIPFIAVILGYDSGELNTADKLGTEISYQISERYTLSNLIAILQEIVEGDKFTDSQQELAEDRFNRSGQITLLTFHKAKGLDWDVVFMPFIHDKPYFTEFIPDSQKFLGDCNLPYVTRAYLRHLLHQELLAEQENLADSLTNSRAKNDYGNMGSDLPTMTIAAEQGKQLKEAEELRLFYVGLTRAKRLLCLSACSQPPKSWHDLKSKDEQCDTHRVLKALIPKFPQFLA
ncbi:MAG: ATP-dependent helicase [Pseudanabaena sp. ELA607]